MVAGLLVAVVLLLDAMAACPALHELIHHDADTPGHHCAVTMFAHGQVDAVSVGVTPPAPSFTGFVLTVAFTSIHGTGLDQLPPARGPPDSSLAS